MGSSGPLPGSLQKDVKQARGIGNCRLGSRTVGLIEGGTARAGRCREPPSGQGLPSSRTRVQALRGWSASTAPLGTGFLTSPPCPQAPGVFISCTRTWAGGPCFPPGSASFPVQVALALASGHPMLLRVMLGFRAPGPRPVCPETVPLGSRIPQYIPLP